MGADASRADAGVDVTTREFSIAPALNTALSTAGLVSLPKMVLPTTGFRISDSDALCLVEHQLLTTAATISVPEIVDLIMDYFGASYHLLCCDDTRLYAYEWKRVSAYRSARTGGGNTPSSAASPAGLGDVKSSPPAVAVVKDADDWADFGAAPSPTELLPASSPSNNSVPERQPLVPVAASLQFGSSNVFVPFSVDPNSVSTADEPHLIGALLEVQNNVRTNMSDKARAGGSMGWSLCAVRINPYAQDVWMGGLQTALIADGRTNGAARLVIPLPPPRGGSSAPSFSSAAAGLLKKTKTDPPTQPYSAVVVASGVTRLCVWSFPFRAGLQQTKGTVPFAIAARLDVTAPAGSSAVNDCWNAVATERGGGGSSDGSGGGESDAGGAQNQTKTKIDIRETADQNGAVLMHGNTCVGVVYDTALASVRRNANGTPTAGGELNSERLVAVYRLTANNSSDPDLCLLGTLPLPLFAPVYSGRPLMLASYFRSPLLPSFHTPADAVGTTQSLLIAASEDASAITVLDLFDRRVTYFKIAYDDAVSGLLVLSVHGLLVSVQSRSIRVWDLITLAPVHVATIEQRTTARFLAPVMAALPDGTLAIVRDTPSGSPKIEVWSFQRTITEVPATTSGSGGSGGSGSGSAVSVKLLYTVPFPGQKSITALSVRRVG